MALIPNIFLKEAGEPLSILVSLYKSTGTVRCGYRLLMEGAKLKRVADPPTHRVLPSF